MTVISVGKPYPTKHQDLKFVFWLKNNWFLGLEVPLMGLPEDRILVIDTVFHNRLNTTHHEI